MIKLKDVLAISSAHEIKVKNLDDNKAIWEGSKSDEGYADVIEEYNDYEVVGIKSRSAGRARNNVKSILVIEIQCNDLE